MAKTATAAVKTPKPKPAAKKAPKAEAESKGQFGAVRDKDLPWSDKKVAVLSGLKKLKAYGESSAKGAAEIAEAGGVTTRDVRHYCYHAKAGNLVEVYEAVEGTVGYRFALTAAAKNMDFAKEFAKQQKEREAKKGKKDE